jgi:hypothetical protein
MRHFTPSQLICRLPALAAALALPLTLAACDTLEGDGSSSQGAITNGQITQSYQGSPNTSGGPDNQNGAHQTAFVPFNGAPLDGNGPFFQNLGTNGRRCDSCHVPSAAWGITPREVQARFNASGGTDPIFRTNDGSNSPNAQTGTLAQKQSAYSLLLNRGTIRVGIGIPTGAEFTLFRVEDPYGFASSRELSLFRRPLPSTNLKFLATVMWDGRENANGSDGKFSLTTSLSNQSNDATLGHAAAAAPISQATRDAIVNFEMSLFTAQITDNAAGSLSAAGATGGPGPVSGQNFFVGINDPVGQNPTGAPFSNHVFSVYDAWATSGHSAAQASIARGQNIFNARAINISGVRGVNDVLGIQNLSGFCTTCHDAPNAGDHSVGLPLDLGLTDANKFNTDTTPRYTLCRVGAPNCTDSANMIRTSDPGRALINGKWASIATFKGPILRGLAARRPYFHNGFAANLAEVVNFYDTRFHMGLTSQDVVDLQNFLAAL